jgi:putative FmdB family regulatory protein
MPIYEYECPKCGRFDALQKMSAKPLEKHDVCGSKVRKLVSASAFAFKGSGFYITDYNGRNSAAITGKGEPKGDARPESKPDAKKDAKPAEKPAACASCPANKSAA